MKIPLHFARVSVIGNKSKQHIFFGVGILVRRSNYITRSKYLTTSIAFLRFKAIKLDIPNSSLAASVKTIRTPMTFMHLRIFFFLLRLLEFDNSMPKVYSFKLKFIIFRSYLSIETQTAIETE